MKHYKQEVSTGCECCIRNNSCMGLKLLEYAPYIKVFHSHILSANDHVYHIGDTVNALYVIKSGAIKNYVINDNGDEQILSFSFPNDVIGLDDYDSKQYVSSAIALQTSSVCAIPLTELKKILNEVIPEWLLKLAVANLKQHGRNISLLNKKKAKSRIAAFLIDTADNCKSIGSSGNDFELSMSRDDIGNYLGLASETVSRTLTQLQQKGWVKMERRHVTIVDVSHLSEMAQHR